MGAEGTVSGETVGLGREEPGAPESRVAAEIGRSRGVDGRGEDHEGDQHRPENRESLGIRDVLRYRRHVVESKKFVWRCAITRRRCAGRGSSSNREFHGIRIRDPRTRADNHRRAAAVLEWRAVVAIELTSTEAVEVEVVGLLVGDCVLGHSFHWRKRACLIELLTSRVE